MGGFNRKDGRYTLLPVDDDAESGPRASAGGGGNEGGGSELESEVRRDALQVSQSRRRKFSPERSGDVLGPNAGARDEAG